MALFKPASPASTEVNSTTGTPVVPVDVHVSSGRETLLQSQPEIDLIHHQMDQPQSFGDFNHGSQPATAGRNQVNLPLLLPQEQGDLASTPTGDEKSYDMRETHRSLANWKKKHKLCLLLSISYYYTYIYMVKPEGTTLPSLQSTTQTTMEAPATWTIRSRSSESLTGRTGPQLKDASTTGTTGVHPGYRNTPTTTGQGLVASRRHAS